MILATERKDCYLERGNLNFYGTISHEEDRFGDTRFFVWNYDPSDETIVSHYIRKDDVLVLMDPEGRRVSSIVEGLKNNALLVRRIKLEDF
jgi:hypothetical protein